MAFVTSGGLAIVMLSLGIFKFINRFFWLAKSSYSYIKQLEKFSEFSSESISEEEVKKVLNRFLKHQKELASK